ncbi:ethanolamine ammonia-lyase reactivating factor EutA [Paenibacillus mucilaginosus]|uniref:Ethanolamine utilization protein EutA n=1 Tax=Paenibacillus mucilaginosus (strain KNP414) TaxID=1036673 RepID=F8FB73_PAEMK|nr:ethanolamine ammonia-lyase reactivating factor EutA [Paenibacillus mucilaginosus]AEI42040.1 hypothetical protein KNP414_03482 [Paenibacillus mucilaginosus KNP414]MCG7217438.1 ethanolamine ammonia-lyase reactivating factor EutA [Paenibacillus mucilaginosus]WDM28931.1 ethanolamine ammonia-lyase reactivating factor EutA [Paenibacillus mucilaginosus]
MEERWITSVGIDLGTSTTKWILSGLKLVRSSGDGALPRVAITDRVIRYASELYPTPLKHGSEIDAEALIRLMAAEYGRAGITPEGIHSGAVIITGETAAKTNAGELIGRLARGAGTFVAAAAGADLEALLAGRGSGAADYSRRTGKMVVNVDIGGGTANAAWFRSGELTASATLHIGGRLIRLGADGEVLYAAEPLRRWLEPEGAGALRTGGRLDFPALREICRRMAAGLVAYIGGPHGQPAAGGIEALLLSRPEPHKELPVPEEIWISGGVGALMRADPPASLQETARYGDIGPLLAAMLREEALACPVPLRPAEQQERATVIGAGTQTTELSGATMYLDAGALPLRGVPAVVCGLPEEHASEAEDATGLRQSLQAAVKRGASLYGAVPADPPFALVLRGDCCSYRRLQRLAAEVTGVYASAAPDASLLLVVCESDMAKALGQQLARRFKDAGLRMVCLDQLRPEEGDYLDIGLPLGEELVPVVRRTLIFQQEGGGTAPAPGKEGGRE